LFHRQKKDKSQVHTADDEQDTSQEAENDEAETPAEASNEEDANPAEASNDEAENHAEDYVDKVMHWVDDKEAEHAKLREEFAQAKKKLDEINHGLEEEEDAEVARRECWKIEIHNKWKKFKLLKTRIEGMEKKLEKILEDKENGAFESIERDEVNNLHPIDEEESEETEGDKPRIVAPAALPAEYRVDCF